MEKSQETQQNDSKKGKALSTTNIILICGFAILLIAVAVVGYMILNKPTPEVDYGEKTPMTYGNTYVVSDEASLKEIEAKAAKEVEDGMFLTTMNVTWNFQSSDEASYDAYIANDASNKRPVYIEVSLNDTGELIYRSDVLVPGTALKELVLGKNLEKGTYPAVCTYYLIDAETEEVASTLSLSVTINIAN